jgi:hypothetical protein
LLSAAVVITSYREAAITSPTLPMSISTTRVVTELLSEQSAPSDESVAQVRRLDAFGVFVSSVCAVHCVIVALFLAALPVAGATLVSDPRVEFAFVVSALAVGFVSLGLGYWRVHRDERPLVAFAFGATLLMVVRPALAAQQLLEALIVVVGATAIIAGHLGNRRLLHRHTVCGTGHSHAKPHAI